MAENGIVSALPNAPLSQSNVSQIDDADGVERAIPVTWKQPSEDDAEVTEDITVITAEYIRYLSREQDGHWVVEKSETYADDEEFETVLDDVHDYARAYSEAKVEAQVANLFGEE